MNGNKMNQIKTLNLFMIAFDVPNSKCLRVKVKLQTQQKGWRQAQGEC